jgi:hypothetical protein
MEENEMMKATGSNDDGTVNRPEGEQHKCVLTMDENI